MSATLSTTTRRKRPALLSPGLRKIIWIALALFAGYLLAAWIIFMIEADAPDALIKSYPQALWYTLVTATTVGYGDLYPMSGAGRIVAGVLITLSVGFLGYVIGKFGELAVENSRRRFLGMDGNSFTGHYLIIGWTDLSRVVIKEMIAAGFDVAVLTNTEAEIGEIRSVFDDSRNFFVTYGLYDEDDPFHRLGIERAAGAILLTGDDTSTLISVLHLRQLNPTIKITAYIQNSQLKRTIEHAGVNYVISPNEVVGRMIASATFEPDVSSFLEDIMSTTTGAKDLDVHQYRLNPGHELVGRTVREAIDILDRQCGARFLTYSRLADGEWSLCRDCDSSNTLAAGDYILLLNTEVTSRRASEYLGVQHGRVE